MVHARYTIAIVKTFMNCSCLAVLAKLEYHRRGWTRSDPIRQELIAFKDRRSANTRQKLLFGNKVPRTAINISSLVRQRCDDGRRLAHTETRLHGT